MFQKYPALWQLVSWVWLAMLPVQPTWAAALPMSFIGNGSHWIDLNGGRVWRGVSNKPQENSSYSWRTVEPNNVAALIEPFGATGTYAYQNAINTWVKPMERGMVTLQATDSVTGQVLQRDYRVYRESIDGRPNNNMPLDIGISKTLIDIGETITLTATSTVPFEKHRWWVSDLNAVDQQGIDLVTQYGGPSITLTGKAVGNVRVWVDGISFSSMRSGSASVDINVRDLTPNDTGLNQLSADCLFNWAERHFAEAFAPAGSSSISQAPIYFRYYPVTQAYLAVFLDDLHVYYLGPLLNNGPHDLGPLSQWLATANCAP